MANQYNQWVPTAPVHLPIDTYLKAAGVAEQRTQGYYDKLGDIFGGFAQVDGVSPDAQAAYDQAMSTLKSKVDDISKMNLKTPEAYRKYIGVASDPSVGKQIYGVYQDYLYTSKMKTDLEEYLKKNPENNAWPVQQAINAMGKETGDASKFNPYRHRNVAAIPEYYNYWDKVAQEVKALKEDKNSLQRIIGDKYKLYETEGVLESRIKDIAIQRVMNDPQARAQFQRDIQYQAYRTNPDDVQEGFKTMANNYRENLLKTADNVMLQYDKMLTELNKKDAINPKTKKPYTDKERENAANDLKTYADNLTSKYLDMAKKEDNPLVMESAINAFAGSFKSYANSKVIDKEWLNPMAVARFNQAAADARQKRDHKWKVEQFQKAFGDGAHTTNPSLLQQQELSPDKIQTWVKEKLGDVLPITSQMLNKNGVIEKSAYTPNGGTSYPGIPQSEIEKGVKSGFKFGKTKWYAASDVQQVISPAFGGKIPDGWEELSGYVPTPGDPKSPYPSGKVFNKYGKGIRSMTPGDARAIWIVRKGAKGHDSELPKTKVQEEAYNQSINEIKTYLDKMSGGTGGLVKTFTDKDGNFNSQAALQAIINHKRTTESAFLLEHSLPGGTTDDFRTKVMGLWTTQTVYDEDGDPVKITPEMKKQFAAEKPEIKAIPTDLKEKVPQFTWSIGGHTYRTNMDLQNQAYLRESSDVINNTMIGNVGATRHGNDLVVNRMMGAGELMDNGQISKGGETAGLVVPGGASEIYQTKAKIEYDKNISKLTGLGMNKTEAISYLKDNYAEINNSLQSGIPFKVKKGNKEVELTKIIIHDPYSNSYYSPDLTGYTMQNGKLTNAPNTNIGNYIYNTMESFGGPNNPYSMYYNRQIYGQKAFMGLLMGGSGDYGTGDSETNTDESLTEALSKLNDSEYQIPL